MYEEIEEFQGRSVTFWQITVLDCPSWHVLMHCLVPANRWEIHSCSLKRLEVVKQIARLSVCLADRNPGFLKEGNVDNSGFLQW